VPDQARVVRIFLDAGVIIDGCFNRWGACKGVLILSTIRTSFTIVLADPIMVEVKREIARRIADLGEGDSRTVIGGVEGWLKRIRIETIPWPSTEDLLSNQGLLAAVRHANDMPSVVAAVIARPDWVLSTNDKHWNQDLAERTGLRIATPVDFLAQLKL
jgi:hypothetical protein